MNNIKYYFSGPRWHQKRRILNPAFNTKVLNEFHPIMGANVNRLVKKLNVFADSGESFDAQHLFNLATLDVICGKLLQTNVDLS